MQTYTGRNSGSINKQTRRIAIFAVLLFGLSGLISGFAVGAFVRPKFPVGTTNNGAPPVSQSTSTKTTSQTNPIPLGWPVIDTITNSEIANDTTSYTLSAHAVDTSIDSGHGKPLHATGITCKLWIEHIPGNGKVELPSTKLVRMDLQQPLTPYEIASGLTFSSSTPQIQQTNANGQVTWSYTVATNVDPGHYYLVVLMDWQGKSSDWYYTEIRVEGTES